MKSKPETSSDTDVQNSEQIEHSLETIVSEIREIVATLSSDSSPEDLNMASETLSKNAQHLALLANKIRQSLLIAEMPAELGNTRLVNMGVFFDHFDEVITEAKSGRNLILMAKNILRAKLEVLQDHTGIEVKRRSFYRQRGKWMEHIEKGEQIILPETEIVLVPLSQDEIKVIQAFHGQLQEWSEEKSEEKRHKAREKARRYHDSKRTPKQLARLKKLREERAKYKLKPA